MSGKVPITEDLMDQLTTTPDQQKIIATGLRSVSTDRKLGVLRKKMNKKGKTMDKKTKKKDKKGGFWSKVKTAAIVAAVLFYLYLFALYGPVLLGCTVGLIFVGGVGYLLVRSRPKDDDEVEE